MASTALEKRFKKLRLNRIEDIIGKEVKAATIFSGGLSIVFKDNTFIFVEGERGYDEEMCLSCDKYLDLWDYYWHGLITIEEKNEALKRMEMARKQSDEYRDKMEYKRLKEKYEGK